MADPDEPLQFLKGLGTNTIDHNSGHVFLEHLQSVQRVLEGWGVDKAVCLAGLFHSIYGTEGFQDFTLSLNRRNDVVRIIGERAEAAAYHNCVMDRDSLDADLNSAPGQHAITMREDLGGQTLALTDEQWRDLITVHLADWLEQVERHAQHTDARHEWHKPGDAWGYRRHAYRRMAELVGGRALATYEEVFSREGPATRHIHQRTTPKHTAHLMQTKLAVA